MTMIIEIMHELKLEKKYIILFTYHFTKFTSPFTKWTFMFYEFEVD